MLNLSRAHLVVATCFALTSALLPACGSAEDAHGPADATSFGKLSVPLVATANGHTYRLRNATVFVYGPEYVWLQSSDDPGETTLSRTLRAGRYVASLQGFSLEKDDGAGVFAPVEAHLVSRVDVPFDVFNGTHSTISYRFETDGAIVTIGAGELRVSVEVEEVAPLCTPFASDCGEGTWCVPGELSGAPRACVPQGTVAVGERCSGPIDCVANASCFDFGAGPRCAALCASSSFDSACASGGICTRAGQEYGVCRM